MSLRIVEYKGIAGFKQLEASWRRLYASMPERTNSHSFELHLALAEYADLPDDLRCFVLTDGEEVRVICPLEVLVKRKGVLSVAVYRAFYESGDVIAPEDGY